MLTIYGDASGSAVQPNEKAQIVAGFLGNTGLWCDFDTAWRAFLERHKEHLRHGLHMTELTNEPVLRAEILDDAIDIICNRIAYDLHVITTIVDAEDFKDYQHQHGQSQWSLGAGNQAYPFAAMTHAAQIHGYCRDHNKVQPTEFIYEAGDPYQKELGKALVEKGFPEPIFNRKSENVLPLQACDFLAFEMLNGYRKGLIGDPNRGQQRDPIGKPNRYLLEFMHMQGDHGAYTRENMPKLSVVEAFVRRLEAIKKSSGA